MRTAVITLTTLLLSAALAGCGGGPGDAVAVDPGSSPSADGGGRPAAAPAADGLVRTRTLATVMDTGTPELCLGPVAESYPPQCSGPEIAAWDWQRHGGGMFEQQGEVRWGTYAVTGRWDGTRFEVTDAVPGALYDAAAPPPAEPLPSPAEDYSADELTRIAEDVADLPGIVGTGAVEDHVLADATYDDGSLQRWVDEEHGAGVVVVTSLLVPAEG